MLKLTFRQHHAQDIILTLDDEVLPETCTSNGIEKYGTKYLLQQAICQSELKSPTFVTQGNISAEI